MAQVLTASAETVYYVAHGEGVVHYGWLPPGSVLTTGQPNLEEFDNAILMGHRAYTLKPDVFEEWVEERGNDYDPGDFVIYNSTPYIRTDDEKSPWALVLPLSEGKTKSRAKAKK